MLSTDAFIWCISTVLVLFALGIGILGIAESLRYQKQIVENKKKPGEIAAGLCRSATIFYVIASMLLAAFVWVSVLIFKPV